MIQPIIPPSHLFCCTAYTLPIVAWNMLFLFWIIQNTFHLHTYNYLLGTYQEAGMTGALLLVTVLTTALIGISAGISNCPAILFINIAITPCSYDESEITRMWNHTVLLPDGYFLKVVDRNGTLSPCVYQKMFRKLHYIHTRFNTSFTPQMVSSVEESPVCSPEQRLGCLQSTHVRYLGTDYFGISVWNERESSAQYLFVDSYGTIRYNMSLINTSFNLENVWKKNVFNCEDQHLHNQLAELIVISITTTSPLVILLCIMTTICTLCVKCESRIKKTYKGKRDER